MWCGHDSVTVRSKTQNLEAGRRQASQVASQSADAGPLAVTTNVTASQ